VPKEEVLVALLVVVAGVARLAGILRVPYPVLLVIGGLGVAAVPGLPTIELDPDIVFLIFLPPLLYHAAFLTSPRELRSEWRAVGLLSVGLVALTILAVAAVVHEVANLGWPASFIVGAVVGPTDPVAATTVFRRIGLPERLITILEGESLTNDGTALVALKVAIAATGATVTALDVGWKFFSVAIGGVLIGIAAGWVVSHVRSRIDDPPVEITISLFTPYLAYIPAEEVGVSGVLAAVTVGLYLAWQAPTGLFHPSSRLQALAFWDVLIFLLNSLLFILVGLQIRPVLSAIEGVSTATVIAATLATIATVVATRLVWMLVVPTVFRSKTPFNERVLLGWSGMRGAVSMAAALSVPLNVNGRPLILVITFAVIIATLVGQGLTVGPLANKIVPKEEPDVEAEANAREQAARAALDELDKACEEGEIPEDAIRYARRRYELRLNHLTEEHENDTVPAARALQRRLVEAERRTIEQLHSDEHLDQATTRRLERELDLEEERFGELERSSLN
jgi:CPA1 family monovalent cation:H+ antiporter